MSEAAMSKRKALRAILIYGVTAWILAYGQYRLWILWDDFGMRLGRWVSLDLGIRGAFGTFLVLCILNLHEPFWLLLIACVFRFVVRDNMPRGASLIFIYIAFHLLTLQMYLGDPRSFISMWQSHGWVAVILEGMNIVAAWIGLSLADWLLNHQKASPVELPPRQNKSMST